MAGLSQSPGFGGGGDASVDTRFDASQYAFFGMDVVEEVELGGLEDEECDNGLVGLDDESYNFSAFGDKEESNKVVSEQKRMGVPGDSGYFSREGSSAADWAHEPDFSNWPNQHILDTEDAQDDRRRWSQPHLSEAHLADSKSLYRTSSIPQQQHQQHQQHLPNKPLQVPESYSISYPATIGISEVSLNHSHRPNFQSPTPGPQMPFRAPNFSPVSGSPIRLPELPQRLHYNGSVNQIHPQDVSISRQQQNHWLHHAGPLMGNHSNGSMPTRLLPQQQQHRLAPFQPSVSNSLHWQSELQRPYSAPHMFDKFEAMNVMTDFGDQRWRPTQNGRHNGNGWPVFQSKYMSAEEIEGILRIHHAATHSNDPYTDDYYHQACVAKRSDNPRQRHNFCPRAFRDLSSRPRANNEPHAYLQIDALGRIPFSSLRRPRPLLEVDPPSASADDVLDEHSSTKPLEQEPMLAARIIIEDGICLLLDVDDIDRLFRFNQLQDNDPQLKRRRQVLLEELATSLHLFDPLGSGEVGQPVAPEPKDDLVFLRLVSLPKGRKLLSRYLRLLMPDSELTRIVCMAVFRHLRFLFGSIPSSLAAAETTSHLATTVSLCVRGMNLSALSACLAAIVCSSEQPPLRPLGNSAGDWASVIIKSVLERVTELFTDHDSASRYSMASRALWQASFDSFFRLLTMYCLNKYDSIMQSLMLQAQNTEASKAISREIPVELLRASLPHTDEQQRKMLMEFAQRSLPVR